MEDYLQCYIHTSIIRQNEDKIKKLKSVQTFVLF